MPRQREARSLKEAEAMYMESVAGVGVGACVMRTRGGLGVPYCMKKMGGDSVRKASF